MRCWLLLLYLTSTCNARRAHSFGKEADVGEYEDVTFRQVGATTKPSSKLGSLLLALPVQPRRVARTIPARRDHVRCSDGLDNKLAEAPSKPEGMVVRENDRNHYIASAALIASFFACVEPAHALAGTIPDPLPYLTVAGHWLSLFGLVGCLAAQRVNIKPNMDISEEVMVGNYDKGSRAFAFAILLSGYFRATGETGKGLFFYEHEPFFWLKVSGVAVLGACSLFQHITTMNRNIAIERAAQDATLSDEVFRGNSPAYKLAPMSEKLAARKTTILNAQLSSLLFIPIMAHLMAEGVGYNENFPTDVIGPIFFGLITVASCFKYIGEAYTWKGDW